MASAAASVSREATSTDRFWRLPHWPSTRALGTEPTRSVSCYLRGVAQPSQSVASALSAAALVRDGLQRTSAFASSWYGRKRTGAPDRTPPETVDSIALKTRLMRTSAPAFAHGERRGGYDVPEVLPAPMPLPSYDDTCAFSFDENVSTHEEHANIDAEFSFDEDGDVGCATVEVAASDAVLAASPAAATTGCHGASHSRMNAGKIRFGPAATPTFFAMAPSSAVAMDLPKFDHLAHGPEVSHFEVRAGIEEPSPNLVAVSNEAARTVSGRSKVRRGRSALRRPRSRWQHSTVALAHEPLPPDVATRVSASFVVESAIAGVPLASIGRPSEVTYEAVDVSSLEHVNQELTSGEHFNLCLHDEAVKHMVPAGHIRREDMLTGHSDRFMCHELQDFVDPDMESEFGMDSADAHGNYRRGDSEWSCDEVAYDARADLPQSRTVLADARPELREVELSFVCDRLSNHNSDARFLDCGEFAVPDDGFVTLSASPSPGSIRSGHGLRSWARTAQTLKATEYVAATSEPWDPRKAHRDQARWQVLPEDSAGGLPNQKPCGDASRFIDPAANRAACISTETPSTCAESPRSADAMGPRAVHRTGFWLARGDGAFGQISEPAITLAETLSSAGTYSLSDELQAGQCAFGHNCQWEPRPAATSARGPSLHCAFEPSHAPPEYPEEADSICSDLPPAFEGQIGHIGLRLHLAPLENWDNASSASDSPPAVESKYAFSESMQLQVIAPREVEATETVTSSEGLPAVEIVHCLPGSSDRTNSAIIDNAMKSIFRSDPDGLSASSVYSESAPPRAVSSTRRWRKAKNEHRGNVRCGEPSWAPPSTDSTCAYDQEKTTRTRKPSRSLRRTRLHRHGRKSNFSKTADIDAGRTLGSSGSSCAISDAHRMPLPETRRCCPVSCEPPPAPPSVYPSIACSACSDGPPLPQKCLYEHVLGEPSHAPPSTIASHDTSASFGIAPSPERPYIIAPLEQRPPPSSASPTSNLSSIGSEPAPLPAGRMHDKSVFKSIFVSVMPRAPPLSCISDDASTMSDIRPLPEQLHHFHAGCEPVQAPPSTCFSAFSIGSEARPALETPDVHSLTHVCCDHSGVACEPLAAPASESEATVDSERAPLPDVRDGLEARRARIQEKHSHEKVHVPSSPAVSTKRRTSRGESEYSLDSEYPLCSGVREVLETRPAHTQAKQSREKVRVPISPAVSTKRRTSRRESEPTVDSERHSLSDIRDVLEPRPAQMAAKQPREKVQVMSAKRWTSRGESEATVDPECPPRSNVRDVSEARHAQIQAKHPRERARVPSSPAMPGNRRMSRGESEATAHSERPPFSDVRDVPEARPAAKTQAKQSRERVRVPSSPAMLSTQRTSRGESGGLQRTMAQRASREEHGAPRQLQR